MRYYEPIWNELKSKRTARISTRPALHRRIIKAVTKEKWMDIGYKISIDPHYSILTHTVRGQIITFTLSLKRDYSHITENEL